VAGYGQFVGYEPNPEIPGAYNFARANGPPLTFGGAEAQQLKSRLDAYNSVNQPKVAGPGGGPIDQLGGYGSENAPPSPEQIQSFREQVQGGAPPPPPPPGPAPAPGGQLGYGMRVSPQGTIQKFSGGSAGVSQQQLQQQAGKGTALPRSESVTQQGGMEGDPEYLEARAEANVDKRLQLQEEGDQAVAAAEAESQLAAQRFETQRRLMGEEQARVADLQARVARDEDLKNRAFAEYTSSKVNPDRVFANPGSRVLGALAAAGGAYAATIAKTPNFALEMMNQSIDRDIRAQEAAIRIKGDKANNLLSELRKSGMDLEQARAATKAIQIQSERTQLDALRAKNGIPALQSHFEKLDLAAQEGLREANEAYRQATIGKTTRTTNSVVEYPRAGSAGGWVDVADQLGTAAKVQGLQKGEADIAKANRDVTKGPTASPEKRQAMSALADAANLEKAIGGYEDTDVPPMRENRNVVGRAVAGAIDTIGGKGAGDRATLNDAERRQAQDFADAQQTLGALASVLGGQGALSGPERDAFVAGMAPGATWGETKRAVAKLRSRAELKLQSADATGEAGGTVVTR
jgi:hypothetical protein